MDTSDYCAKLYLVADGYNANARFPGGDNPCQIIARLCEEAGQLAQVVNYFEGTGIKVQKSGLPDQAALVKRGA